MIYADEKYKNVQKTQRFHESEHVVSLLTENCLSVMSTAASTTAPWACKRCTQGAPHNLLHKPALCIRNKVHICGENSYTNYISKYTD